MPRLALAQRLDRSGALMRLDPADLARVRQAMTSDAAFDAFLAPPTSAGDRALRLAAQLRVWVSELEHQQLYQDVCSTDVPPYLPLEVEALPSDDVIVVDLQGSPPSGATASQPGSSIAAGSGRLSGSSRAQPWSSSRIPHHAELYDALDFVLRELRAYMPHSEPFLSRVRKSEAPNYYEVIERPMDLGTMGKKLRRNEYRCRFDFHADLNLIWSNCRQYNTLEDSVYRQSANAMERRANQLMERVPARLLVLFPGDSRRPRPAPSTTHAPAPAAGDPAPSSVSATSAVSVAASVAGDSAAAPPSPSSSSSTVPVSADPAGQAAAAPRQCLSLSQAGLRSSWEQSEHVAGSIAQPLSLQQTRLLESAARTAYQSSLAFGQRDVLQDTPESLLQLLPASASTQPDPYPEFRTGISMLPPDLDAMPLPPMPASPPSSGVRDVPSSPTVPSSAFVPIDPDAGGVAAVSASSAGSGSVLGPPRLQAPPAAATSARRSVSFVLDTLAKLDDVRVARRELAKLPTRHGLPSSALSQALPPTPLEMPSTLPVPSEWSSCSSGDNNDNNDNSDVSHNTGQSRGSGSRTSNDARRTAGGRDPHALATTLHVLRNTVAALIAHAGFDTATSSALDALTDCVADAMTRTARLVRHDIDTCMITPPDVELTDAQRVVTACDDVMHIGSAQDLLRYVQVDLPEHARTLDAVHAHLLERIRSRQSMLEERSRDEAAAAAAAASSTTSAPETAASSSSSGFAAPRGGAPRIVLPGSNRGISMNVLSGALDTSADTAPPVVIDDENLDDVVSDEEIRAIRPVADLHLAGSNDRKNNRKKRKAGDSAAGAPKAKTAKTVTTSAAEPAPAAAAASSALGDIGGPGSNLDINGSDPTAFDPALLLLDPTSSTQDANASTSMLLDYL